MASISPMVSVFGNEGAAGGFGFRCPMLEAFNRQLRQKEPLKRSGLDLALVEPTSGSSPHLALVGCLVV